MGLGLLLLSCAAESKREAPTAVNGVIDLSDWDFERDGPVELIGEWKVHWGQVAGSEGYNDWQVDVGEFTQVPEQWFGDRREYTGGRVTSRFRFGDD